MCWNAELRWPTSFPITISQHESRPLTRFVTFYLIFIKNYYIIYIENRKGGILIASSASRFQQLIYLRRVLLSRSHWNNLFLGAYGVFLSWETAPEHPKPLLEFTCAAVARPLNQLYLLCLCNQLRALAIYAGGRLRLLGIRFRERLDMANYG